MIVRLRNTVRAKGVTYHPGAAVDIPDELAAALGLSPVEDAADAPKAAKPRTGRKPAAAPMADTE